jgi:hypothetical protein
MPQRDNFMLACPLAYHPAVARRFVEDMRAFQAAEPNAIKRARSPPASCMG